MKLRWRELSEYHLPQKLLQHIDKVTERHHDYRDNIFYVSELTGCIRQAYLNRTLKPKIEDYDFTQKWRLFRGIIFDQAITTLFERNQVRITHRVKNPPIVITGKADFIEDDVLWELKTVSELPEKPQSCQRRLPERSQGEVAREQVARERVAKRVRKGKEEKISQLSVLKI